MLASALTEGTSVKSICNAQGGYFLVAQTDGRSDVVFAKALGKERGVVCTPMSVFYATPFGPDDPPCELVRFTICKSESHVSKACDALRGKGT